MPPVASVRRLVPILAALLALLALAVPAAALADDCPGADGAAAGAQAVSATLCLLNAERAAQGLAPLSESAVLDGAAAGHAGDMVSRQFFDHTTPDGRTVLDRLTTAGYIPASGFWAAGENIAWGSGDRGTPRAIVAAWMASPGHRANILQGDFREIGIGIATGAPQPGVSGVAGTYVTDFGARDTPAPSASAAGSSSGSAGAPAPAASHARSARRAARCASAARRRTTARRASRRCGSSARR